ncbi:hypothetical protein MRX96_021543 [Rhipicephalus microplus]
MGGASCRWGDGGSRRLSAVRHSCSGAGRRGHRPSATCPPARNPHGGRLGGQNLPPRAPRRHQSLPGGRPGGGDRQHRHRHRSPKHQSGAWPRGRGRRGRRSRATLQATRRGRHSGVFGATCRWTVSRGRSVAARWRRARKRPGGAQLPTDAAVGFCATCRVTVHFKCHYKGAMHVARTKAAAEGRATDRKTPDPAPLSQRSDADLAALCRQRMGEDPHFAAILSGLPPPVATDGPPMDGVATMDVDRLLEL